MMPIRPLSKNHPPVRRCLLYAGRASIFFLLFLLTSPAMARIPLEVKVTGLNDTLKKNVLHFLDIEKMKKDEELTTRWIKRLHEQAPQEIREALQPYGYYLPDIQSQLTETKKGWLASYKIHKGKPVNITKRDVQWSGEGADNPIFQQSIQDYHQKAGNTLNHSEYESAKNKFMNLALSTGYPKARFTENTWLVDLEKNNAELTLHMDTGPLYYFGDVRFRQNFLDPELLQHYVTIKKGAPYSHESLLGFQQNLLTSNYAQEVTVDPLFDEAVNQQLPLDVLIKPIAPHKFMFGLGYETDVGVRGSARWSNRLINRHGHHSDVYLKLSQEEGILRGEYSIPVLQPLTDRWVSSAEYEYEVTPSTQSSTFELETAFVRRNLADTLFYKGFILASTEKFSIEGSPKTTTGLLTIGGTARFSKIEKNMFPQKGRYLFADLRGAAKALLSDTSYTRIHLKGRYLRGLGKNGRIDTRLEIGAAWVNDFDIYPASLRFFAGGDNSIRGYEYESLGPENTTGDVVGGKNIMTCSFEYDHRVKKSWVVAGFIDAGNAYNDNLDKTYVGAGTGFRWLAPFGSLRVDIAWPVSEQPELDDWRVHIGFGATL
ncbi:MAG: autotransporter assembly complex family protein [Thermodesulfobacteriota bacterium]|nr:autotransporter assembly complex family protein [Thermodesulfobacteriota bacterium]